MAQYALPISDVSKSGPTQGAGNSDANAWDELDEGFGAGRGSGSGPDDATTYWDLGSGTSATAIMRLTLSTVTDPVSSTGHYIRARARKSVATGQQNDLVTAAYLSDGTTLIALNSWTGIDEVWRTYEYALPGAGADLITSYAGLQFEIYKIEVGGGSGRTVPVSALEFECPNAPSGGAINANIPADAWGNIIDQAPTIRRAMLGAPAADNLNQWVDQPDIFLASPNITISRSDALGSYVDTIEVQLTGGGTRQGWVDQLIIDRQDVVGVTPIETNLPADNLAGYADTILSVRAINVAISDSLGLYADQPPIIAEGYRAAPAADSLGLYLDQTPTILFTGELRATPSADSLGLYADPSPVIREGLFITPTADAIPSYIDSINGFFSIAARPADDINQWIDQASGSTGTGLIQIIPPADNLAGYADTPSIREAFLVTPAADSLPAYADTSNGFFTLAVRPSDDLNQWADQRTVSSGGILSVALADSLVQNDSVNGFFTLAVRPSDDLNQWADQRTISSGTGSIQAQPSTDSLNNWLDTPNTLFGEFVTPIADSMAQTDQLSVNLSVVKSASFTDAIPSYADQVSIGAQKIAAFSDALGSYSDTLAAARRINVGRTDALANWADQVTGGAASLTRLGWQDSVVATTLPIRLGWQDSVTVFRSIGTQRVVQLTSAQPIPQDSISEGYGYRIGPVVYLVDGLGNYIVDENGNRIIASGLIDNLQQGDSVAITRTTAGTTPRLVTLTDALPIYADTIQVSRGIVTLDIPFTDALPLHIDALIFVQLVGLLVFSSSDALGSYSDSIPGISTSGEKRVDQSDALANYGDSIQSQLTGNLSVSLTDAPGIFGDSAQVNTSGGLLVPLSDTLSSPIDSIQVERGGALTISLIEAQGGSFADARALILGIRKAASDNLAAYTDSRAHGRGLLYSTPPDGLANYLDTVTRGGAGLLQAALSDNLAQYNDVPTSFANIQAQPLADDLASYADSLSGLFALNYALFDEVVSAIRLRDFLDLRIGLFNELRFGLTDDLNQWADAAAYSRVFYAIRLGGNITERITLTGKVIEEQIGLNGKLEDNADIIGELYIGDP